MNIVNARDLMTPVGFSRPSDRWKYDFYRSVVNRWNNLPLLHPKAGRMSGVGQGVLNNMMVIIYFTDQNGDPQLFAQTSKAFEELADDCAVSLKALLKGNINALLMIDKEGTLPFLRTFEVYFNDTEVKWNWLGLEVA